MPTNKITLSSVKALKPKEIIWDTELKGFGCRCQTNGKFFILKYSLNGRQRFYTIGEWGNAFTPDKARQEAEILKGKIRTGIDPMTEREKQKKIPLVKDAFEIFLEHIELKHSKKTYSEYRRLFEKHIKQGVGKYKIDAVTRADIAKLHQENAQSPYQANNILKLLSSFFSWCAEYGHRTDGLNPCTRIKKFKDKKRERFLSEEELFRLSKAINQYEEMHKYIKVMIHKKDQTPDIQENISTTFVTAAIKLLIFTGARCNEILSLTWSNVDLQNRLIRLQESKTGQKTIYLSAPALKILSEIPRIEGNPYVICGKKINSHLINIKDPWRKIRKAAGLEDVRIHDLRHNYASTAVVSGHHLKVIGSLLGHADTQTTERYAHLANDPLQTANEAIGKRISDAMIDAPKNKNVVTINS